MRKNDPVFFVSAHNQIVKARVVRAHRDGSVKIEATYFYREGRACGPYIGDRYEVTAKQLHPSELSADYAIQAARGLAL